MDSQILSRKYATAFLNLFIGQIEIKDFCALGAAGRFLALNPELRSLFKLPRMDEAKKEVVDRIIKEFNLAPSLQHLTDLLQQHQRLFLLPHILYYIQKLYKERRGIMEFTIQSSHALTKNQLTTIKNFLSRTTGHHILCESREHKKLIAGIRLQSDTLLWERSVARRLVEVRRLLQP